MSVILDVLYHWSPSERRVAILRKGLKVYSKRTVMSQGRWPYICLSTRPSLAWGLSGDFRAGDKERDPIEDWDLWEVRPPEDAEIHVREFWWPKLEEFKCYTSIPADCLWYAGSRSDKLVALDDQGDKPLQIDP